MHLFRTNYVSICQSHSKLTFHIQVLKNKYQYDQCPKKYWKNRHKQYQRSVWGWHFGQKPRLLFATHQIHITLISKSPQFFSWEADMTMPQHQPCVYLLHALFSVWLSCLTIWPYKILDSKVSNQIFSSLQSLLWSFKIIVEWHWCWPFSSCMYSYLQFSKLTLFYRNTQRTKSMPLSYIPTAPRSSHFIFCLGPI